MFGGNFCTLPVNCHTVRVFLTHIENTTPVWLAVKLEFDLQLDKFHELGRETATSTSHEMTVNEILLQVTAADFQYFINKTTFVFIVGSIYLAIYCQTSYVFRGGRGVYTVGTW